MITRYKTGKLDHAVNMLPGDQLNLTISENGGTKQRVSEEIKISKVVTHWVMFYVPGVGIGGIFGGPELPLNMDNIFVEAKLVNPNENLVGE